MNGNRVIALEKLAPGEAQHGQTNVVLKDPTGGLDEFWVYDEKTKSIRSFTNYMMTLSFDNSNLKEVAAKMTAVVRPWQDSSE